MAEPIWAQILSLMYERDLEGDPVASKLHAKREDVVEKFAEEINEDTERVQKAMTQMNDMELIDGWDEDRWEDEKFDFGDNVKLTGKGFEVAHERELSKRQALTNTALVVFTFALVLANVVGNYPDPMVQRWGGFLILLLLIVVVLWTDLLDLPSL